MPGLTILHLEDDPLDAELICAAIEEGGFACAVTRVDTRDSFLTAVQQHTYDVILADYSLPSFDGLSALDIVRDSHLATPFILISGVLGEDIAIESLKRGATDYVLKHHLERLAPAIERALREAQARAERQHSDHELAQAYERERLINQITRGIRLTADPEVIKKEALCALGKALNADRCYYIDYDFSLDLCTITMDWYRDGLTSDVGQKNISDFAVNLDPEYLSGNTQVIDDTQAWLVGKPLDDMTYRAMVRVPLTPGGLTSALVVAMIGHPHAWTPHEIMVVETVAVQTQAAVEAAQVRQREQRIATVLQNALQPPLPEEIPGLQAASYLVPALDEAEIGGDFYDIFELDTRRYAVVIGDVTGKGLAAAAQVSIARNMLRVLLYERQDAAASVTILNSILIRRKLLTGFITLVVAIYDHVDRTLSYVSCGHEPGLLYRSETGHIDHVKSSGLPMAVWPDTVYTSNTTALNPGDILLLYTDGLSEAGPNRRDMVGVDGLTELFIPIAANGDVTHIASELVSQVNRISNGIFRDDVCVLVLKAVENPAD